MEKPKVTTPLIFLGHPYALAVSGRYHVEANERGTVFNKFSQSYFEVHIAICGKYISDYDRGATYYEDGVFPFCQYCEKRLNKIGLTRQDCKR